MGHVFEFVTYFNCVSFHQRNLKPKHWPHQNVLKRCLTSYKLRMFIKQHSPFCVPLFSHFVNSQLLVSTVDLIQLKPAPH